MVFATPFFQGFGPLFFGPAVRPALRQVARVGSLAELHELFGHLLPEVLLAPTRTGPGSRQRLFSTRTTFWAFAAQVLSPGTSCREIVRRAQAWRPAKTGDGRRESSVSTSAYCQARRRLEAATLESIRAGLCANLERHVLDQEGALAGRAVKIVDGTCLSLPDTPGNQALWPQPSGQRPGCGFPVLKLVALFSLGSGALLASQSGNLHAHESTLFRRLWHHLRAGDIVLADRAFCSYAALAALWQERGVDSVVRLHQRRPVDFRCGRVLGPEDRLVTWQKPPRRPEAWSPTEFEALPPSLSLRLIRLRIAAKGYRTRNVVLVTTLLDPTAYPAEALRALYGRRWQVEGHFAQIKTSLGLDALRGKSPELIEREVLMHQIAYNLVRCLMQRAAYEHGVPLVRLSFKGALDTLRHWSGLIAAAGKTPRRQQKLIAQMLALIAADPVPLRPGRSEPRAKKRRGKNYQLLTRPRRKMGRLPRRNRARAKTPKSALS